jgi:hypothetical protein
MNIQKLSKYLVMTQRSKMLLSLVIKDYVTEFKHHYYNRHGFVKFYNDSVMGMPFGKTLTLSFERLFEELCIEIAEVKCKNNPNLDKNKVTLDLRVNVMTALKKKDLDEAVRVLALNHLDKYGRSVIIQIGSTLFRTDGKHVYGNKPINEEDMELIRQIINENNYELDRSTQTELNKILNKVFVSEPDDSS